MAATSIKNTQSGFPVSIGTGLSLESLFNPVQPVYDNTREVPNKIDTSIYNNYIFNISTLLRNMLNSIPSQELFTTPKKNILDSLLEEIDWLTNFFQMSELNINFYINNYNYVKSTYKDKKVLRVAKTDKQLYLDSIYKYCLDNISKEDDVKVFSNDIKYNKEDTALIFTHVPWDLLSYKNFVKLDLLESHTGILKTRKNWNTKYYKMPGNRDMSFLPFIEYLLASVFGDNVMFQPAPLNFRIDLYNTLLKKNVHPLMDEFTLMLYIKSKVTRG